MQCSVSTVHSPSRNTNTLIFMLKVEKWTQIENRDEANKFFVVGGGEGMDYDSTSVKFYATRSRCHINSKHFV
jgi:hypothetical protein